MTGPAFTRARLRNKSTKHFFVPMALTWALIAPMVLAYRTNAPMAPLAPIASMYLEGSYRMPSGNIMTPEFRASYAYVFRPQKAMDPTKEPKHSCVMLFKKGADLAALEAAANEVAIEKWGKGKLPKNLRTPFRDQGEKEQDGYVPGALFITATSKEKPGLVDRNLTDIIDEKEFYSGCYARATVRAFAYDNNGNKGVAFGLQNIQKLRDGEALGGRTRATDDFEALPEEEGGVFDEAA